jgi:signal transduction histidine kinase
MHPEETRIFYTILMASVVLALLFAFFVITIIRHQRRKMVLENEKIVAEVLLLEKERGRIAADLHDELGALVSAVKLNLQCLDTVNEQDAVILEKTGGYIDTTMQKIREISNNLMPKSLQKKGLFDAVEEFTMMITNNDDLKIRYQCDVKEAQVSPEKQIHIYRIVQEITNNALKHAKASLIDVRFSVKKNILQLDISDNGAGFDTGVADKNNGHGLQNIMRRADMLQGTVYLESKPGKGTSYSIEIPL